MVDTIRKTVASELKAALIADTAVTNVRDATERRQVGIRRGAGALVSISLVRLQRDSVTLRLSTRDMTEDRTPPMVELRIPVGAPTSNLGALLAKLVTDLNAFNWGPRQLR